MSLKNTEEIQNEIKNLAKKKNAVILAHNYQRKEIQETADFLGDSLYLSKKAAQTEADMIVFCGVTFMAETAKVLSPEKKVLIPRFEANCPMANMITSDDIKKLKQKHPSAYVVAYVNTTAEVKALADSCCASGNAAEIVKNINNKEIIFVPDKNLGAYCQKTAGKKLILFDGYCYVHNQITKDKILRTKQKYPNAEIVAHPECPPETLELADKICSTEGMITHIKKSENKEFIIATEPAIIYRLNSEIPGKQYFPVIDYVECKTMKLTCLEDLYNCLNREEYEINLEPEIIKKAKKSLTNMLKYC
ncbi:MAG TPA: quinolinate synthase NadA [bacterium]|nr:quinolinate synthase NadA [bacterium]HPN30265.1 quinolinate synthase NadA [bacterium]